MASEDVLRDPRAVIPRLRAAMPATPHFWSDVARHDASVLLDLAMVRADMWPRAAPRIFPPMATRKRPAIRPVPATCPMRPAILPTSLTARP